jgi:threonine dehydrogenase-like Zn-dependent dehydrogenase
VLEGKRVDPTQMATHMFSFEEMERAFEVSGKKPDNVIMVLITF